jgi:hypothetical protein
MAPPLRVSKKCLGFSLLKESSRTVLHCAHRGTTVSSCALWEQEEHPAVAPSQLLSHLFPLFRHLRFARGIAFGRLRHHHGFEAPLQKRFGKGLRTPHT